MSNDFLTDEELAELEAELGDLDAPAETPKATAKPKAEPKPKPAPEPERALEATLSSEDEDALEAELEAAELEAELNVAEPTPEPAVEPADDELAALEAEVEEALSTPEIAPQALETAPEAEAEAAEPKPVSSITISTGTINAGPVAAAEPISTSATNNDTDDDTLMDMVLNSGSSFDPRQLQKDLAFSEYNLDDAFMSQAGMFAHYSGVAHRAARRYDQLAQQEKLVYAKLDQDVRQQAADDGEKITEAAVKNRILLDPRHRKITERLLDARAVAGMTKDACDAFKQRRDMLIQVGANAREEQKGELRMKAVRETQDDAKQRALDRMKQG